MRRFVLVAWVLTGCNAVFGLEPVGAGDDRDAAGDGAGPGGDASTDDAPPVDAACAAEDVDCDGVTRVLDNCPTVANADQHDEDADRLGDACDNCPHISNLDQADTTEVSNTLGADGIGDACDPHPNTRDRLVLFDPFSAATAARWQFVGADQSVAGDALVMDGHLGVRAALRLGFPAHNGQLHVVTRFTVDTVAPVSGSNERSVALLLGTSTSSATGRRCVFWYDAAQEMMGYLVAQTDSVDVQVAAEGPLQVGQSYALVGHTVPAAVAGESDLKCWQVRIGATVPAIAGYDNAGPTVVASIGVTTSQVGVRFQYIVAYEHLP